jgi:uncharacterized protein (TIGR00369 family)
MADPPDAHVNQNTPAGTLLGREWLGLDRDTGIASFRFHARADFANRHGTVQGGFLAAMLDAATGLTLLADLPPELTAMTLSLDTKFLKPAPQGPLTARARVLSRDDRNATVEAEIFDPDGHAVAHGTAALRIVRRR